MLNDAIRQAAIKWFTEEQNKNYKHPVPSASASTREQTIKQDAEHAHSSAWMWLAHSYRFASAGPAIKQILFLRFIAQMLDDEPRRRAVYQHS